MFINKLVLNALVARNINWRQTVTEIISMKVRELRRAQYNPRDISEDRLRGLQASIKKFGIVELIIWNKRTNTIVGGHQRLTILEKEMVEETEVVVVDLDEDEEKQLNITLNNPHIQGSFTDELEHLLEEMNDDAMRELNLDKLSSEMDADLEKLEEMNDFEIFEPTPTPRPAWVLISAPEDIAAVIEAMISEKFHDDERVKIEMTNADG